MVEKHVFFVREMRGWGPEVWGTFGGYPLRGCREKWGRGGFDADRVNLRRLHPETL